MDSSTSLSFPKTFPFPITITRLLVNPGDEVTRGTPLLEYAFTSETARKALQSRKGEIDDARENDMIGSWECPIEGTVVEWEGWVKIGIVVDRRLANKNVLKIEQPCSHPVQRFGLCAICGKEMEENDYLSSGDGSSGADMNSKSMGVGEAFEMAHDASGVIVSKSEARRLDNQTRDSLLSARKLSLIVDLDQTIIHTTVDPTVGEWMAEIEEEQTEQSRVASAAEMSKKHILEDGKEPQDPEVVTTTPPGSPRRVKEKREPNPNAEALKDVAKFQLEDDLPPGYNAKSKVQIPSRCYYTKPRPGLTKFLDDMAKKYEMHVYTMGTRNYADAIVKVIDPEEKIFGGRILSRDESGSFSSKSLKRLFPTDQSMVVVIDDRSDVWNNIPNLVKVIPYDFFVGIGDINSSFLPPNPDKKVPSTPTLSTPDTTSSSGVESPLPVTPGEEESLIRKKELLDSVSEERPLAKLQEKISLEQEEGGDIEDEPMTMNGDERAGDKGGNKALETEKANENESKKEESKLPSPPRRAKPLLKDDDRELDRIAKILTEIHHDFYQAYDERDETIWSDTLPMSCDVELIIPTIKNRTLGKCNILFSGLIPRHIQPEVSDIWQTAETFGARCSFSLNPAVTHCVTANQSTEKVYKAIQAGIKVVWSGWFEQCIALWKHVDEGPWLVMDTGGNGSGGASRVTSGVATPATDLEGEAGPSRVKLGNGQVSSGDSGDTGDSNMDVTPDEVVSSAKGDDMEGEIPDADANEEWGEDDHNFWEKFEGEGGSDIGTEDLEGRTTGRNSPLPSPPGTPRKRVRYADEEDLPLSTYRNPPEGELANSPKRRKAILLPAPEDNDDVPEANKMQWKGKMVENSPEEGETSMAESSTASEPEDDDEFARLLMESMDDD